MSKSLLSKVSRFALIGMVVGSVVSSAWAMEEESSDRYYALLKKHNDSLLLFQLPPETFINILSYLSPKKLSEIALVSSGFNTMINDKSLWDPFLYKLGFIQPINGSSKKVTVSLLSSETVYSILESPLSSISNKQKLEKYVEASKKSSDEQKSPLRNSLTNSKDELKKKVLEKCEALQKETCQISKLFICKKKTDQEALTEWEKKMGDFLDLNLEISKPYYSLDEKKSLRGLRHKIEGLFDIMMISLMQKIATTKMADDSNVMTSLNRFVNQGHPLAVTIKFMRICLAEPSRFDSYLKLLTKD